MTKFNNFTNKSTWFWDKSRPHPWLSLIFMLAWIGIIGYECYYKILIIPMFGTSATEAAYNAAMDTAKNSPSAVKLAIAAGATAGSAVAINFYSAIASATGSLLGFLVTAATIFLTIPSADRLRSFAENGMLSRLFKTFVWAILSTAASLVFSLVGMFTKYGLNNFWEEYIIQMFTLISLSLALTYLLQSVFILADTGANVLTELDNAAQVEKDKKRTAIDAEIGPRGNV